MNDLEDFVLDTLYVKTPEDNESILQASPQGNNQSNDWEKSCLGGFKERLRSFYLASQRRRCAYCRTIIKVSQAPAEIEHIVHKSFKPEWMYEPFNLCVSCKSCNTKKSTKPVLDENISTEALPLRSDDYIMIHPHLDKFSEHINIIDDVLYEGISDKGRETIRICELFRYELAADRAEDKIKMEKPKEEQFLLSLSQHHGNSLVNVYSKFEERIHEIYEEFSIG